MTNWNDLTDLERAAYKCFPSGGHLYDSYDPNKYVRDCGFWGDVEDFSEQMKCSMEQVKGVLASLVKKGLIQKQIYDEYIGNLWWYGFTEDGYQLLTNVA